jgi:hypothetical protein
MTNFITDEMMEEALVFLSVHSALGAEARAERFKAEHARKRVRANLILTSEEKTVVLKEAWSEQHPRYVEAIDDEAEAIRNDEFYRSERNKAEAIIEAWRSEQANQRAGTSFK